MNNPFDRRKFYKNRDKALAEAWKKSSGRVPSGRRAVPLDGVSSVDPFDEAVWAYHEKNDIKPLMAFVASDRLSSLSSDQRHSLSSLIELLHALGQSRRPGKPGGKHTRWNNSNYIAAYLVEQRLTVWKKTTGRRYVSHEQKQKVVDEIISEMKGWALTQRKRPPQRRRVLELLREPKNRRL